MISKQRQFLSPPGLSLTLGVFLVLFLLRSLVTFPIEHVDAAFKYLAAADLVRGSGLEVLLRNHHTMRWAEVLPQALVTFVTGFRYEGLYLLPLAVFAGYCTLLWRGMRPALSNSQLLLLLALLFLEPLNLQHTGQLLNPAFGVFFTALALTLLARPGPNGWARTALCGLLFFAAYGAHSTYLSFMLAGVLWLGWFESRPWHALGLILLVLSLIGLESLVFNALAGASLSAGRIEALAEGGHLNSVALHFRSVEPAELILRWFDLPWFDRLLSAGYLACLAWLGVNADARKRCPDFLKLCLLAGGSYALAITFAVVDLSPLRPFMPLRNMYLEPFLPFAAVATVYFLAELEHFIPQRRRPWVEAALVLVMVSLLAVVVSKKTSFERIVNYRLNAFMWSSQEELGALGRKFSEGEILLVGQNRGALLRVIQYQRPVTVRQNFRHRVAWSGKPGITARCVRSIRRIPLERNEKECARSQLEVATGGERGVAPRE